MSPSRLLVLVTAGARDPRRATMGLEAALAAAASGVETAVFLTLEATEWACLPRKRVCGEPVYAALDQLLALGVRIVCCSACAIDRCGTPTESAQVVSAGIELAGLAVLVEQVASGVPSLSF